MIDISLFKKSNEHVQNSGDMEDPVEEPQTTKNVTGTCSEFSDYFTARGDKVMDSSRPQLDQQLASVDAQIEKVFAAYNELRA